jgi:hypothetical protein
MRAFAFGLPKGPNSLVSYVPKYEEILESTGERKKVILIPVSNGAEAKGFIAFLDPPVREGVPRKFRMEQWIKREFANVQRGGSGLVSYGVRQLAKKHILRLTIEVRAAQSLGALSFQPEGDEKIVPLAPYEDPSTNTIYRVYSIAEQEIPIFKENSVSVYFRQA